MATVKWAAAVAALSMIAGPAMAGSVAQTCAPGQQAKATGLPASTFAPGQQAKATGQPANTFAPGQQSAPCSVSPTAAPRA